MNKLIVISIFCLLSFGFTSTLAGQSISSNQTELIKSQVDSIFLGMVSSAEKLDFEDLNSGVNDTRRAGFISSGKYYASYSTLAEETKSLARGISEQDISFKDKTITVLSDKMALVTASGVSKVYLEDGRELVVNFQWSFLYEKIDNNWKVIHSHQSSAR